VRWARPLGTISHARISAAEQAKVNAGIRGSDRACGLAAWGACKSVCVPQPLCVLARPAALPASDNTRPTHNAVLPGKDTTHTRRSNHQEQAGDQPLGGRTGSLSRGARSSSKSRWPFPLSKKKRGLAEPAGPVKAPIFFNGRSISEMYAFFFLKALKIFLTTFPGRIFLAIQILTTVRANRGFFWGHVS
jgi:hypothetical protein